MGPHSFSVNEVLDTNPFQGPTTTRFFLQPYFWLKVGADISLI